MKTRKPLSNHFVICIDNTEYPASLEKHKIYRIIFDKDAEQDGDLRVIDESGEDYLYPSDRFVMVDLPQNIVRVLNKSFSRGLHQIS
jgi:hypothetical protein